MPAPAFTNSDYVTYDRTDATRLTKLRALIKEILDAISTGSYSESGASTTKSVDKDLLERQLTSLRAEEKELEATLAATRGKGARWTRGKML